MLSKSVGGLQDISLLPPGVYGEQETLDILSQTGIAVVERALARSADAAIAAAAQLGYPVVLKLSRPSLLHKSDVGGVRTGLRDADAVHRAYMTLASPEGDTGNPEVVLVERQLEGHEVLVGVKRDRNLGPVVAFGAGGTLVELAGDVTLETAPISRRAARELIGSSGVGRLLTGYRGQPGGDVEALANLLVQVGDLAAQWHGLMELDLNPVIVGADFAVPVDARMVVAENAPERRPRRPVPPELFLPRSIAVVGASTDESKPGNRLVRYLKRHGFPGQIVPVNARGGVVAGVPAVESIRELKDPVDLACLAVPGNVVPETLLECAEKGIPAAIVFSAGFAEAGTEGKSNQDRLDEIASEVADRLRYCGPNSIGIISPNDHVVASFSGALEGSATVGGSLAFLSQSGAIGSALVSRAWEQGIGFSRWVSTGNEQDLDVADYLEYLADDPETEAVLMFLEAIRNGDAFRAAALRCIRNGKALLAYKTGRSDVGQRSVVSHTGAVAGDDEIYDVFLRNCGVVRVDRLQELIDGGQVVTRTASASGRRVAIITMSGGAASVMADRCSDIGLELPPVPMRVEGRLRELIPGYGSVQNPIDVTVDAVGRPEILTEAVKLLLEAEAFDLVLCQLTTNADPSATVIAESLLDAATTSTTPLLIGRQGADSLAPEAMRIYRRSGYPVFDSPERVVEAAGILVARWEIDRRLGEG